MKVVYIILLNISENCEGNVNFENLKRGMLDDKVYIETFRLHVFIAIHYYYNHIFLNEINAWFTI